MSETGPQPGLVDPYGRPLNPGQEKTVPILDAHGNEIPKKEANPVVQAESTDANTGVDASTETEASTEPATEAEPVAEPAPPEVEEAKEEKKKREVRASDVDLILQWLVTDRKAAGIDENFLELFKKVMEEKGEGAPDSIDETKELVKHLGELFADFDKKIEELAVNKAEYSGIKGKQIEIKKAICLSVINGHFSATDIPKMVTGVQIESRDNPHDQANIASIGYEAAACWDQVTGKITIFKEALVDNYRDKDGNMVKINFKHLVSHEMSHAFTERYLVKNEKLNTFCDELMDEPALLDLQPQHVRNVIKSLENIDERFVEAQTKNPRLTKEQYVKYRRDYVKKEIITDYTAMFVKSDGSLEGFVEKCLALMNKEKFDQAIGVKEKEINPIFSAKTLEERQAIIAKLRTDYPAFGKTLDLWTGFHGEIQKATSENKGKVSSHEEYRGQSGHNDGEIVGLDESDELDESAGFYEPAGNFAEKAPQSRGGGGPSIWANIGGLMKAMAEDAPNIEEPIGK